MEDKEKYRPKYGIEKIGLFGSYARDEATEKSDIDIVIEIKPKSLVKRMELKRELEKRL